MLDCVARLFWNEAGRFDKRCGFSEQPLFGEYDRFSVALNRLRVIDNRSSVAFNRFRAIDRRFLVALNRFRVIGNRSSVAFNRFLAIDYRFLVALNRFSVAGNRFSVAANHFSFVDGRFPAVDPSQKPAKARMGPRPRDFISGGCDSPPHLC